MAAASPDRSDTIARRTDTCLDGRGVTLRCVSRLGSRRLCEDERTRSPSDSTLVREDVTSGNWPVADCNAGLARATCEAVDGATWIAPDAVVIRGPGPMPVLRRDRRDAANHGERDRRRSGRRRRTARWQQADAQNLPFADARGGSCQFGVMFFPTGSRAIREVQRVLKPGSPIPSAPGRHCASTSARQPFHEALRGSFGGSAAVHASDARSATPIRILIRAEHRGCCLREGRDRGRRGGQRGAIGSGSRRRPCQRRSCAPRSRRGPEPARRDHRPRR